MEDKEIIDLACDVLSKIIDDLNNDLYKNLSGTISLEWDTSTRFYAYASVSSEIDEPPQHSIGLSYNTAILLYRDIENYYDYIEYGADNEKFDFLFKDFDYPKILSPDYNRQYCCQNMFISGITWIFFHEFGHLIQEHGHIRMLFKSSENTEIIDCSASDNRSYTKLTGKSAAVSHATEMAADYYAMISLLMALVRHFQGVELQNEIKSFASVLALVLYRFHGAEPYIETPEPIGSHPPPLIRLEQTMPVIHEFYTNLGFSISDNYEMGLSRLDIINITSWASFSVGLFWLRKHRQLGIPEHYFLSGSVQRPGMIEYHRKIVSIWDEIKVEIDKFKRANQGLYELNFTEEYRKIIFKSN